MKMKMIKKYEGGQSLSAIARELGLSPGINSEYDSKGC
jgi:hypothetical protein